MNGDAPTRCGSVAADLAYIDSWLVRMRQEIHRRYARNHLAALSFFDNLMIAADLDDGDPLKATVRSRENKR